MSTHMFLWRTGENYPRTIIKYSSGYIRILSMNYTVTGMAKGNNQYNLLKDIKFHISKSNKPLESLTFWYYSKIILKIFYCVILSEGLKL